MIRCCILALALLSGLPHQARAQIGGAERDCQAHGLTETRFTSRPLGDGRYLYQVDLANRGHTAIRYSYSFSMPGSTRPAEALNGYLTPGASIEHALGTGDRNLSAEAMRAETTLRCFSM
ncbi:MAG: hypothetical protein WCP77_18110 [Roseococcus sp.]